MNIYDCCLYVSFGSVQSFHTGVMKLKDVLYRTMSF